MSENSPSPANTPPIASAGCLLRLFWLLIGNAAIYLALATIAATKPPLPSSLDFVVGITLLLMIAARWLDITRNAGRTVSGEPATLRHWRLHAAMLVGLTLTAWALAHFIAGSFSK